MEHALAGTDPAAELEVYRGPLMGYCYRMLGSPFDAEEAVQETMLRGWRGLGEFEGRAKLKSWLFRIATNVCLDRLEAARRRVTPLELGGPGSASGPAPVPLEGERWVEPIPDERVASPDPGPAAQVEARETLRLAFVVALQRLPARQRAVLILCEVLRWKATEAAELLDTSVASVNSALQRARATLDGDRPDAEATAAAVDDDDEELLDRYVGLFEAYDVDGLVALLAEDATLSMPPYALWLRGPEELRAWWLGWGSGCRGSRLLPIEVNGTRGFGQYRPAGEGRPGFEPWAVQLIERAGGRVTGLVQFLDTDRLFPLFGLPPRLDG